MRYGSEVDCDAFVIGVTLGAFKVDNSVRIVGHNSDIAAQDSRGFKSD